MLKRHYMTPTWCRRCPGPHSCSSSRLVGWMLVRRGSRDMTRQRLHVTDPTPRGFRRRLRRWFSGRCVIRVWIASVSCRAPRAWCIGRRSLAGLCITIIDTLILNIHTKNAYNYVKKTLYDTYLGVSGEEV
jgi:hypothetical protein